MKKLIAALQLVVSTAIVVYIIRSFDVSLREVSVGPQSLVWFAAVIVILGVQLFINAVRWRAWICWVGGPPMKMGRLMSTICAGQLFSQILPTGLGYDVVRGLILSRATGGGVASRSVFLDTVSGLVLLLIVVLALSAPLYWRTGASWLAASLAISCAAALSMFCIAVIAAKSGIASSKLGSQLMVVVRAIRDIPEMFWDRKLVPIVVPSSLAILLASPVMIYLISQGSGMPLVLIDCLLIVPCALLVSALPIGFSGWGVRESSMAAGFALVGAKPDHVILISMIYGLTAPLMGIVYYVSYLSGYAPQPRANR